MSDALQQAKRPVTTLAGPYGHPVHPILVTVPIGAWVTSLVFDIASHVVAEPAALAQGSRWLIAVGVLGALAAAMFGFLDFLGISPGTVAYRTALLHMGLNLSVIAAYAINFVWRQGMHATGNAVASGHAVPVGPVVLAAASLVVLGVSGFLGGKLVFRYGIRVVDEATQGDGFRALHPSHKSG